MIWLISVAPPRRARSSSRRDQASQFGSRTATSIRTLVSIRVATSAVPCHRHDGIGIERRIAGSFEAIERRKEPPQARLVRGSPPAILRHDGDLAVLDPEQHFAVR